MLPICEFTFSVFYSSNKCVVYNIQSQNVQWTENFNQICFVKKKFCDAKKTQVGTWTKFFYTVLFLRYQSPKLFFLYNLLSAFPNNDIETRSFHFFYLNKWSYQHILMYDTYKFARMNNYAHNTRWFIRPFYSIIFSLFVTSIN